jgi:membrane glycosyltransferase
MPVYNEEVGRIFRVYEPYLNPWKRRAAEAFDFFILSDSSDLNCWIAEEAWFVLKTFMDWLIFYRKRRVQLHNKSGNIADFAALGRGYRYMIVLMPIV